MAEQIAASPKLSVGQEQLELLKRLSNACAVSGDEGAVRRIVREALSNLDVEITVDALGNLYAFSRGRGQGAPRVMLAAHMDEVGLMLTHDEGEGRFRFAPLGGLRTHFLAGKKVLVGKEGRPGVIGLKPVHLDSRDRLKSALQMEALRVDVGLGEGPAVHPGDRATFATRFRKLGPSLLGKAMDDRIGVATLIELIRHAPREVELQAVFTVQEEIGLRGAQAAVGRIDPELAIALDCTPAYDLPAASGEPNPAYNTRLDGGPALYAADRGTVGDRRLLALLKRTAAAASLPCQIRQPGGGRTDAAAIHVQRAGIPSISVSVPGRYLHSPAALVRQADWEHTLNLLHLALRNITPELLAPDN